MIFFGTSAFSIHVLNRFLEKGIRPEVIVTVPDRPAGRKMLMTPPPVKVWAEQNGVHCIQFEKLNQAAVETLAEITASLPESAHNIFIVASYGKIIPQAVLDIPEHGSLNVHPSLLPKLRGATPLQTSILEDMQQTGVTIIQMDKEMDHGPILAQWSKKLTPWPMNILDLEKLLAEKGADILLESLPDYIAGKAELLVQNHDQATFTRKITKEDGFVAAEEILKLDSDTGIFDSSIGYKIYLKFQALSAWPGLYFFVSHKDKDMRVKVKEVLWNEDAGSLEIIKITPEGRGDMTWKDFQNFLKN